jgi:hypothetical protein
MMPNAPEREMVDLSMMLLPSGPKLSRMAPFATQPDEEYDAFCAGEMGEYYGVDDDQDPESKWWDN